MICRGFKEHVSSDEANDSKCQSAELSRYGEFESPKIYIKKTNLRMLEMLLCTIFTLSHDFKSPGNLL